MRLNEDCVRDVLLSLEDALEMSDVHFLKGLAWPQIYNLPRLEKYDQNDLLYTLIKLEEADLIVARITFGNKSVGLRQCYVESITYEGHHLLDNVRSNKVWKKVKEVSTNIGGLAIPEMVKIAAQIVLALGTQLV